MNKWMGYTITLLHLAGGLITGYYAFMLRMHHEELPLTVEDVLQMANNFPLMIVGPLLILVAIIAHAHEINHAKAEISEVTSKEIIERGKKIAAQNELDEHEQLFNWVQGAIQKAVAEDAMAQRQAATEKKELPKQAKDYYDNHEHPSA